MTFQRPHNLRPKINTETGEVEEVVLVETPKQRQRRLANQARQDAVKEKREKAKEEERASTGAKTHEKYMPRAFPWESIENYFVQGAPDENGAIHYPTLSDLVSYFHVNYLTVRKKMLDENWIDKRDQWQSALQKQIQKVTMIDYVEAANKFDATCVEAAQYAMQEILDRFHEAHAQNEPIQNLDLDRLGRAATAWQRVGRLSLGLSTENTARHDTKSPEALENLELGLLTDDELLQVKHLLQRAESREISEISKDDVIEGVVIEQPQQKSETQGETNTNDEHQVL